MKGRKEKKPTETVHYYESMPLSVVNRQPSQPAQSRNYNILGKNQQRTLVHFRKMALLADLFTRSFK